MIPSVVLNVSLFLIPFPSLHVNFVPTCLPAGAGLLTFVPRPSVFACLCMCLLQIEQCLLDSIDIWHRAKFVVQLCHGELPMFFWILTEEYPPNPIGQVIWEWRGEFRQDFKGLCEPQKWRVKLSSITTVATARNFRRNRSTNVHDLQDLSSTEVLDRIRGGLCWP